MGAIRSLGHLSHFRFGTPTVPEDKKSGLYLSVSVFWIRKRFKFRLCMNLRKLFGFYPGILLLIFFNQYYGSFYLPFCENWIFDLNDVFCPMDIRNLHFRLRILQIDFVQFFEFNLQSAILISPNCKLIAYKSKYL